MSIDTNVLIKNKVLILFLSLLIGFVVTGTWFLWGRVFEGLDAMSNIESREAELSSLTEKIMKLEGVDVELYRSRNENMLVKVLPEKFDLSRALGAIVTIVRDGGFEVKSGTTNNDLQVSEGQLQTQRVTIKFEGEDISIKPMVDRLEKVKPLMKAVSLNAIFYDSKTGKYELTVETYGWEALKSVPDIETVILPVIENGSKYEKLFKDIESWEEVIPSLDFVFEGSDDRNPFNYSKDNDSSLIESLSPTPVPTTIP